MREKSVMANSNIGVAKTKEQIIEAAKEELFFIDEIIKKGILELLEKSSLGLMVNEDLFHAIQTGLADQEEGRYRIVKENGKYTFQIRINEDHEDLLSPEEKEKDTIVRNIFIKKQVIDGQPKIFLIYTQAIGKGRYGRVWPAQVMDENGSFCVMKTIKPIPVRSGNKISRGRAEPDEVKVLEGIKTEVENINLLKQGIGQYNVVPHTIEQKSFLNGKDIIKTEKCYDIFMKMAKGEPIGYFISKDPQFGSEESYRSRFKLKNKELLLAYIKVIERFAYLIDEEGFLHGDISRSNILLDVRKLLEKNLGPDESPVTLIDLANLRKHEPQTINGRETLVSPDSNLLGAIDFNRGGVTTNYTEAHALGVLGALLYQILDADYFQQDFRKQSYYLPVKLLTIEALFNKEEGKLTEAEKTSIKYRLYCVIRNLFIEKITPAQAAVELNSIYQSLPKEMEELNKETPLLAKKESTVKKSLSGISTGSNGSREPRRSYSSSELPKFNNPKSGPSVKESKEEESSEESVEPVELAEKHLKYRPQRAVSFEAYAEASTDVTAKKSNKITRDPQKFSSSHDTLPSSSLQRGFSFRNLIKPKNNTPSEFPKEKKISRTSSLDDASFVTNLLNIVLSQKNLDKNKRDYCKEWIRIWKKSEDKTAILTQMLEELCKDLDKKTGGVGHSFLRSKKSMEYVINIKINGETDQHHFVRILKAILFKYLDEKDPLLAKHPLLKELKKIKDDMYFDKEPSPTHSNRSSLSTTDRS